MYISPFSPLRFSEASVPPDPVNLPTESAKVLERLRSLLPDPVDWNTATSIEASTALARAIFDHEAARLTLDLPDDRMDLPVALHMDDPRLLQLLDTARHMHQRDPAAWPMLMDMALEAVQAETADVMGLDEDGLDARDLDNQNMPLYETIHEDMLDHRLETRYQRILNPGTLAAPVATPWVPPLPGTYPAGVLPVRPSPMPLDESPERPAIPEQSQPQPQRSTAMPDYQIREVTDPETQQVSYQTELRQVSQNLREGSRIWGMDAENDILPLGTFASMEDAQARINALQNLEPLRESLRNLEPVTIAGVPYDPVSEDNGSISSFRVRDGLDRTDMPLISPWELQQYAHTGKLTPELAVQQLQNAEHSGYAFTPFETRALQEFARDADADPRFAAYRKQEKTYLAGLVGTLPPERNFSLDELPRIIRDYVQAHRFDLENAAENRAVPEQAAPLVEAPAASAHEPNPGGETRAVATESLEQSQPRALPQDAPASPRTTETGLHLRDLYLPDANRQPMQVDSAFRGKTGFVRAFYNTNDANTFMDWIDAQHEQRAALDRGEPLTLGVLRYVPAGIPGEYRAIHAETGYPLDRQIIDQSALHDLLFNGVVGNDLAQQWQANPTLLSPDMQAMLRHQQEGMYDYAAVAMKVSQYAPNGIVASAQTPPVSPVPETPRIDPGPAAPSAAATEMMPSAAEQQAQAAAAHLQDQDYKDEITTGTAAPARSNLGGIEDTPVKQGDGQEAQQKGQEAQQKDQEAQQKDQKNQQGNQVKNDGQNQKGQGQGQGQGNSSGNAAQNAPNAGGVSLFSRVHQHHHYAEPAPASEKDAAPSIPGNAFAPAASSDAGQPAAGQPTAGPTDAGPADADLPKVSKRETMGVMNRLNQAPVCPEEINVMRHRVEKEGLTPDVQRGIEDISARGQRDVKDGKLTPEQLQKNAHAMNQLGDAVSKQPDSAQKQSMMEHIRRLAKMLAEALKRIFSMGRASAGPSM